MQYLGLAVVFSYSKNLVFLSKSNFFHVNKISPSVYLHECYHLVVSPCEDLPNPCKGIKRWRDEEHACKDEEMHKMCPVST